MNSQEVFNHGVKHLLTQGKKSLNQNGCCAYRGEDGLKCAIGAFIQDKHYHSGLEKVIGPYDGVWTSCIMSGVENSKENRDILFSLQQIHDCFFPSEWEGELRMIAAGWNLSFPENWKD